MSTTVLLTGATRGLGLATAHALAARGAHVLVSGRSEDAVGRLASEVGGEAVVCDLDSLTDVRGVAEGLGPVDVVIANAGLQITGARQSTSDGFERTFQVNHLAHLLLFDVLLARPEAPRRLVTLGSGTHDPATHSGLPAPLLEDVRTMAEGGPDIPRAGLRRYSTSKLLTTATALGLARERRDVHVTCFDPGLMGATGLSRSYAPWVRVAVAVAWRILRHLPSSSTAERSGSMLARLALDEPPAAPSGSVIDFRGRPAAVSARAADETFQDEVLGTSRALLAEHSPLGQP